MSLNTPCDRRDNDNPADTPLTADQERTKQSRNRQGGQG
jgi:hypothetical protein